MPFLLQPLELSDFDILISHANSYPPGLDLVGPPTPICCPVTNSSEAHARLAFHFAKQRARFLGDPTVRYMKVISTPSESNSPPTSSGEGEIVSIARWHYYPTGYSYERDIPWETHNPPFSTPEAVPKDFNIALHNHILTTRDATRSSWMEQGKPCWILMHMVTHPSHRGKGAAGMLIRWGIEQAERDGVPVYLEAGIMGKPVYERFGFTQVGDLLEVDLKAGGGQGVFVMCKMGYFPQRKGAENTGRA